MSMARKYVADILHRLGNPTHCSAICVVFREFVLGVDDVCGNITVSMRIRSKRWIRVTDNGFRGQIRSGNRAIFADPAKEWFDETAIFEFLNRAFEDYLTFK
jgi:hypothetical protein